MIKSLFSFFLLLISLSLNAATFTAPEDRYNLKDWEYFKDHKGFSPYLSELDYRAIADHVIDPNNRTFDPSLVKLGDSIYVAVWYLEWFVKEIHDKIPNPYVLITCDVDSYLPRPHLIKLLYDPKVAYWFAKNMLFTGHDKLFQLPMGHFYHLWAYSIPPVIGQFNQLVQQPLEKDILLYLSYTERPHGRRVEVADLFWDKPYCFNRNRPRRTTSFPEYWEEVSRSKFVLSPLGLEVDCTRTWECFSLSTNALSIPIVEHSYLDPLYEGLPILLVYQWNQLNEHFLNEQYELMQAKNYQFERAGIDYWAAQIHQKQEEVRKNGTRNSGLERTLFSTEDVNTIQTILKEHGKEKGGLAYYGNLSCLRPFQLAELIPSLSRVDLFDLWTHWGFDEIRHYAKEEYPSTRRKLRFADKNSFDTQLSFPSSTVFLDLTYFRHKLLYDLTALIDFQHSLEEDIRVIYEKMGRGGLLIGNKVEDPYVKEVLAHLATKHQISTHVLGDFWFVVKR